MQTIHLRIEKGHYLPSKGETIDMQGRAGVYLVRIKHVLKAESHPTDEGVVLMKVQGTKRLMQPKKDEAHA